MSATLESPEALVARLWPCKIHPDPGACMSPFAQAKVKAIRARDEQWDARLRPLREAVAAYRVAKKEADESAWSGYFIENVDEKRDALVVAALALFPEPTHDAEDCAECGHGDTDPIFGHLDDCSRDPRPMSAAKESPHG